MTHADDLWAAISRALPNDRWLPLSQLYARVQSRVQLDAEDFLPSAPGNDEPKWRRNVRNVLQRQKELGHVEWNGRGAHRLPSGFINHVRQLA